MIADDESDDGRPHLDAPDSAGAGGAWAISRRAAWSLGTGVSAAVLFGRTSGGGAAKAQPDPSMNRKVRTIALEEACLPSEVRSLWEAAGGNYTLVPGWLAGLTDFGSRRLEQMDRCGIEMMVLSLTIPGPQGQRDRVKAEDMARRGNDALAKAISAHPARYAGLACLSMHDVDTACREFERAVTTLGMRGVLLNNFQLVGDDRGALFYDQPEFDAFWDTAQRLDAPVYLHPGPGPRGVLDIAGWNPTYSKFQWLQAASWFWAVDTGSHALRIITSGVFDRYPKAQLVLGHNGEHVVYDMWRLDHRLKVQPTGYPAKHSVRSYFRNNVMVATSGEFSDFALRHVIEEIGADRVLFAIDTPYEDVEQGTSWFNAAAISPAEREAIARQNAIRLLKLPIKTV